MAKKQMSASGNAGTSVSSASSTLHDRHRASATDAAAVERLISAALLATTAFRLRDHDGLTGAMRGLVRAIQPFEA
jgi:hypothetical protein